MSLQGAYEKDGCVHIEDDVHGTTRITWRQALERIQAVKEAEASVGTGRRTPGIQRIMEQMIKAAIDARKKDDPTWRPPGSVRVFMGGSSTPAPQKRILLPGDL